MILYTARTGVKKTEVGYFARAGEGARKEAEALGCAVGNATQWTHDALAPGTRAYVFVEKRERAGQKGWEGNAAGNFDEIG